MCIYIGDIGDNRHVRKNITLYKIKEPKLHSDDTNLQENVSEWQVFTYNYPFDYPYHPSHNAEAFLIDTNSRELIIITKTKAHQYAYSQVFSAPLETDSEMVDTGIKLPWNLANDASSSADNQVSHPFDICLWIWSNNLILGCDHSNVLQGLFVAKKEH